MSVKLIFASDSFKGSLSQVTISKILMQTAKEVFENPTCISLCVSDGGEGALDAIIEATKGEFFVEKVYNPLFEKVNARYGAFNDTAVISMSECSGLTLIPKEQCNPLYTTTFGTGELIKSAIKKGFKKIIITIGGSATNDGGMGALIALGAKFKLKDETFAKGIGAELEQVVSVDFSSLKKYQDVDFTILTDVQNPLTGEMGATKIFSRQKGADESIVERLERGMINYEGKVFKSLGKDKYEITGGGGAGGLGFGLVVGLNAKIIAGTEYILSLNNYEKYLDDATCVITGEGRIDGQTAFGKVVSGVIEKAKKKNVPVFAIVGSVGEGAEELYKYGLNGIYSIINTPDTLENILLRSETLYRATARSLLNTIKSFEV